MVTWKQTLQNACDAITTTTRKVASKVASAFHFHRCSNGHIWKHGEECRGNEKAHTCPRCKELQYSIMWFPTAKDKRKAILHTGKRTSK